MDIIICVNHGKMYGANIVVNATIFNDSLNEFRFRIDGGEWIYANRVIESNKTEDVEFTDVCCGDVHKISCQAYILHEWCYCGYISTSCNTNAMRVYNDMDVINKYEYRDIDATPLYYECEVYD